MRRWPLVGGAGLIRVGRETRGSSQPALTFMTGAQDEVGGPWLAVSRRYESGGTPHGPGHSWSRSSGSGTAITGGGVTGI